MGHPFHIGGVWSLNLCQPTTFLGQNTPSGLGQYCALSRDVLSLFWEHQVCQAGRFVHASPSSALGWIVRGSGLPSQGNLELLFFYMRLEVKSSDVLSVVAPGSSLDKIFGPLYPSELLQSVYGGISRIHPCGQSTVASSAPCYLGSVEFRLP